MQPEASNGTDLGARLGLTENKDEPRQALAIGDSRYTDGNTDNVSKFERIKAALSALEIEDELYVKYA